MRKFKYWTADRETGTFIDCFDTVVGAKEAIKQYEAADQTDGTFQPNFYDIVDANHMHVECWEWEWYYVDSIGFKRIWEEEDERI